MPYKHCAASYRLRNGVRYEQWADESLSKYKSVLAEVRATGLRAFAVRYPREGWARIFREVRLPSASPPETPEP